MAMLDDEYERQYFVAGLVVNGRMNNFQTPDYVTLDRSVQGLNDTMYTFTEDFVDEGDKGDI